MTAKKQPSKPPAFDEVLRDVEGVVRLSNMQLQLAMELRRKLELLTKSQRPQQRRARRGKK